MIRSRPSLASVFLKRGGVPRQFAGRLQQAGRLAATVPELLGAVPGKAIAIIETSDGDTVLRSASALGWGVRRYAGKIACVLPEELSLRAVVDALCDVPVSAVSVQRVSLEHAYLELVQGEFEAASTAE